MEDWAVADRGERAFEDADALTALPGRDDEERDEGHDPGCNGELKPKRPPARPCVAEHGVPRRRARGLGHKSVESFLNFRHR
jgi:hypothetical protein